MNWKPQYTVALIPPIGALVVSALMLMFGASAGTSQWAAIVFFLVTLPFALARVLP